MWCCLIGRVITDIWRDRCTLNFRFKQSKDTIQLPDTEDEGTMIFQDVAEHLPSDSVS
jgi:hypothetical protein